MITSLDDMDPMWAHRTIRDITEQHAGGVPPEKIARRMLRDPEFAAMGKDKVSKMIASALERLNLSNDPDRIECAACGGSGQSTKAHAFRGGVECVACQGQGSMLRQTFDADGVSQHTCDTVEHFTPSPIVEASRQVMGSIDLDPASCAMAQATVQAQVWYGPGSPYGVDGLAEPGAGNVFLNPPGGLVPDAYAGMGTKSNAALWWAVYASMWQQGEIDQMVFLGFTLEILRSVQTIPNVPQPLDFPLCVPMSRIPFDTVNTVRTKGKKAGELIDPKAPAGARVSGTSPAHANVIVWLPPLVATHHGLLFSDEVSDRFVEQFTPIGRCRV